MTIMQQHMESLLQVVNESTATAKLPHRALDVNPLRPKLLITRKTFKAHGPLKWLKYTSV